MPIKFRCNYCRQFLGISRAQAGGIVDCPTCGRSIRVPQLDGTLQPLPEPELNIQDAHLARALDELARLANVVEPLPVVSSGLDTAEDEVENEIPQPIPEPIPIEVPIAPTPVPVQAPYQQENDVPTMLPSDVKGKDFNILAELASVPGPVPSSDVEEPALPEVNPQTVRDRHRLPQISLMMMLAFMAGMLFERFVKILELGQPATHPDAVATPPEKGAESKQVTGRITYKSPDGSSKPDRGARILAFPQQREGEAKLSVIGFRPADSAADARLASAMLQAVGGGLATTDDAGQYRLDVPAGTYQVLALSHFQMRGDKEPVDPALLKLLSAYFDKPEELIGRVKYQFGPLKVKGTGDVWDHSF